MLERGRLVSQRGRLRLTELPAHFHQVDRNVTVPQHGPELVEHLSRGRTAAAERDGGAVSPSTPQRPVGLQRSPHCAPVQLSLPGHLLQRAGTRLLRVPRAWPRSLLSRQPPRLPAHLPDTVLPLLRLTHAADAGLECETRAMLATTEKGQRNLTLMMSLASVPRPGPSSTSWRTGRFPAAIHSLTNHTPSSCDEERDTQGSCTRKDSRQCPRCRKAEGRTRQHLPGPRRHPHHAGRRDSPDNSKAAPTHQHPVTAASAGQAWEWGADRDTRPIPTPQSRTGLDVL